MGPRELAAALLSWRDAASDSVVIDDRAGGQQWSRRSFCDAVGRTADAIEGADRRLALVQCSAGAPTLVHILGALTANHAVLLVDQAAHADFVQRLCELYEPDTLLTRVPLELHGYHESKKVDGLYERVTPSELPKHPSLTLLLCTSGTTGNPKTVRLSAESVYANATAIATYLDLDESERPALVLPYQYSFGFSIITSHLLRGARLVIPRPGLTNQDLWTDVREAGCTSLSGVPYSFRVFERVGVLKALPRTLRTMTQAGGRLDPELGRRFHAALSKQAGRLFVMYGQTEATARISYVPPDRLPEKIGTIGLPIEGGSFTIVNDHGVAVETGHEGELVYRGSNVMLGYAASGADLALGDCCGGVLHTGDMGATDDDGFVCLTARKNRLAKVFGLRIALDDVESCLNRQGAVAAVSDDDRIVIYCDWGEATLFAQLATALGDKYGIHRSAFEFRRTKTLPTNPSGKIDYKALGV